MSRSFCPYCGGNDFISVTTSRVRPETFSTHQCVDCAGHVVKHVSGNVYPLEDRTDKETDHLSRVVDDS